MHCVGSLFSIPIAVFVDSVVCYELGGDVELCSSCTNGNPLFYRLFIV